MSKEYVQTSEDSNLEPLPNTTGAGGKVLARTSSNDGWEFVSAAGDGYVSAPSLSEDGYVAIANNENLIYLAGTNDGDVLTWSATSGTWESSAPTGGSDGYTYKKWDPDAPPASPSSYDDEFDGSSLDPKWTDWQPGIGSHTVTVSDGSLKIFRGDHTGASSPDVLMTGIFQTAPTAPFTVVTKVSCRYRDINTGQGIMSGILFGGDLATNPTTAHVSNWGYNYGGADDGIFAYWARSSYNAGTLTSGEVSETPGTYYLRSTVNGTTVTRQWSPDGKTWSDLGSFTVDGSSVETIGITLNNRSSEDAEIEVEFFRVIEGVAQDVTAKLEGQVVDVGGGGGVTESEITYQLTGDEGLLAPTGWSTATHVELTTDGGSYTISGLDSSATAVRKTIVNADATYDIVLEHMNATLSADDIIGPGTDLVLGPGDMVSVYYSTAAGAWRIY